MQKPIDLSSCGVSLDTGRDAFGGLRPSNGILHDSDALVARLEEDGYVFLPGLLDRGLVAEARADIVTRLQHADGLDTAFPADDVVLRPGAPRGLLGEWARENDALQCALFQGPMVDLYRRLLHGVVRHYDFTWLRVTPPGGFTVPHGDIVFMGRGTHHLFTSWVPIGDLPVEMGGLMVLEGSHRATSLVEYTHRDVDTYCENVDGQREVALAGTPPYGWIWDGALSRDPRELRGQLGGRWLTSGYRMGDVLIFTSYTVHASLDNRSPRARLSADTRYQLASAPIDERWIGEAPVGHGRLGKRGVIC